MKKKFWYALPLGLGLGLAFFGVQLASAHGFFGVGAARTPDQIAADQQQRFSQEAQILGLTVDEVKQAWADGKSVGQLIKEKNLDKTQIEQRAKDAALANLKAQLQTLVDKGVITQAQADSRLKFIQDKAANGRHLGWFKRHGRGHGFGHWF